MNSEVSNEPTSLITCGYKEPTWSGVCVDHEYGLDVLKDGVIIDNIKLINKPYFVIGRYKTCDMIFEHPSLSRFHSILQFCSVDNEEGKEKGWYLMDLDSTHGTIVNKKKIPSHTFIRIYTGHVIKFGGSSRLYIVTGPEDDQEPISKYTWTQLNEFKSQASAMKVADANGYFEPDDSNNATGCTWGMNDNLEDEANGTDKLEGKYKHEHLYKDDPKKFIKNYFEKEGFDEAPNYEFSKLGMNKNICKLELPVFGENGEKIVAEVSGSDKKKDLIIRCAMESCRILDEMDELFKIGGAGRRQKKDNKYYEAKDYYSSDEDDFFDRTGQIEQKRIQRMRRFGVVANIDAYKVEEVKVAAKDSDSALVKFSRLEEINEQILTIEEQLEEARLAFDAGENCSEMDELEKYMEAIQSGALNRKMRLKLRAQIFELTKEENLLRKQLRLSIPVTGIMRASLYNCKDRQDKTKSSSDERNLPNNNEKLENNDKIVIANTLSIETKSTTKQNECFNDDIENESDDEVIEDNQITDENPSNDKNKRKSINQIEDCSDINNLPETKKRKVSNEDEMDDNYVYWVPPIGQTGDGKTSLNDKLGY